MLLVAAGAGIMFYLDRQTLAVLKTTISEALGLSNADYSLLITAYMVPYTVCYLVSGRILDRWGTRHGASLFLLGMAISTLGCALARGMPELMAARGLLGVAESGVSPAIILMMTFWFPAARRAFAMTACQAIQAIAPIAAPPLVAWLALRGDWRLCFVIPAALSLGVAAAWWASDRNAPYAAPLPSHTPSSQTGYIATLRHLWAVPRLRGLVFARIICDPFYFFLIYWHTGFLQEHAGWSLEQVGRLSWIPWVIVPLTNMAVAAWSDHRASATADPAGARGAALRLLACLAPAAALAPFLSQSPALVLALLTLGLAMISGWMALSGVMISELAPAGSIATAVGTISALSGLTSMAFNQIAGPLVDQFGYTALFVVGACLHPLAAWILWRTRNAR